MGVGRRVVAVVGSIAVLGLIPMTADPASSETAPSFHPLQPTRVMDTRSGQGGTQFASNETRYLQIAGVGGVPADAVAVALNVTVIGPTAPGYLTVWPAGSPVPTASNVNFLAGQTVANMVTTGLGPTGGVSIYNLLASAHVIVDVTGWFSAGFHPIRPKIGRAHV